jgi:hypothetical protein
MVWMSCQPSHFVWLNVINDYFLVKMTCDQKLFTHVQLWVTHDQQWIDCEIHLLTFYWMLGVDKYINVWVNLLCQNMTYMITCQNLIYVS